MEEKEYKPYFGKEWTITRYKKCVKELEELIKLQEQQLQANQDVIDRTKQEIKRFLKATDYGIEPYICVEEAEELLQILNKEER